MSTNYGDRYPGAGGARKGPVSGGAGWHPMPEGMVEQVPIVQIHIARHEPSFFGRLVGRQATETLIEEVVGHTLRKHYR